MKKRILIWVISLCLLPSFSACTVQDNVPQHQSFPINTLSANSDSTTDTNTPTTANQYPQLPLLAVSLPTITQTETAGDGTVLFHYTYQNLSLVLPDPEVADNVIIDFLNRIDKTAPDAETIRTAAIADHQSASNWNPYMCQITYDPMRLDSGVLSMFGSHVSYSGAVHAGAIFQSVTYDLITGKVLTLDDILTDTATSDRLCQLVVDALLPQQDTAQLFEGFEVTVAERFGKQYRKDNDWYFSGEGLCYYFSPYEIGPYSAGAIVAEIPYSKLVGIVHDAYFPTEKESASGRIHAKRFEDMTNNEFSQFAEIVLSENEEKILLYTDDPVYDIRIESGTLSLDDDVFTPEYTIFSAYGLSSGNAIMVQANISNTQPTLRLRYRTGNSIQYQYLNHDFLLAQ